MTPVLLLSDLNLKGFAVHKFSFWLMRWWMAPSACQDNMSDMYVGLQNGKVTNCKSNKSFQTFHSQWHKADSIVWSIPEGATRVNGWEVWTITWKHHRDRRNLSKHSFLIHRKDAKENTSPEVLWTKPTIESVSILRSRSKYVLQNLSTFPLHIEMERGTFFICFCWMDIFGCLSCISHLERFHFPLRKTNDSSSPLSKRETQILPNIYSRFYGEIKEPDPRYTTLYTGWTVCALSKCQDVFFHHVLRGWELPSGHNTTLTIYVLTALLRQQPRH